MNYPNTRLQIAAQILSGFIAHHGWKLDGDNAGELSLDLADQLIEREEASRPQGAVPVSDGGKGGPAPGECIANWVTDGTLPGNSGLCIVRLNNDTTYIGYYDEVEGVWMFLDRSVPFVGKFYIKGWVYVPNS